MAREERCVARIWQDDEEARGVNPKGSLVSRREKKNDNPLDNPVVDRLFCNKFHWRFFLVRSMRGRVTLE